MRTLMLFLVALAAGFWLPPLWCSLGTEPPEVFVLRTPSDGLVRTNLDVHREEFAGCKVDGISSSCECSVPAAGQRFSESGDLGIRVLLDVARIDGDELVGLHGEVEGVPGTTELARLRLEKEIFSVPHVGCFPVRDVSGLPIRDEYLCIVQSSSGSALRDDRLEEVEIAVDGEIVEVSERLLYPEPPGGGFEAQFFLRLVADESSPRPAEVVVWWPIEERMQLGLSCGLPPVD